MRRAGLAALLLVLGMAAASAEVVILPQPSRDVTPPGMTPGPKVDGPLERVPAPPVPTPEARWWRFFLPKTSDAATFAVDGGKTIHVAGVEAPPVGATCPVEGGENWPCGRTALFSLRRFLHGRAIECYFPRVDGVSVITAPCRVGRFDLGLWLLEQGWARPDDLATDAYRDAADAAVCARRGIWRGQKPTVDCPAAKPPASG